MRRIDTCPKGSNAYDNRMLLGTILVHGPKPLMIVHCETSLIRNSG